MFEPDLAVVLESGYRCFTVYGAEPVDRADLSVDGTLVEWLDPDPEMEPLLIVKAGAQFGPFDVVVHLCDEAPAPDGAAWEDISEISIECEGELALGDLEDGYGDDSMPLPAGSYRMRVSARGRSESFTREGQFPDENDDEDDETPLEFFLLELWPAASSPMSVVQESSKYAHDQVSPPAPEWPAEREPGLVAARRIAADLTGAKAARSLSGELGDLLVNVDLLGTPTRLFNRARHASGWPPGNGGTISNNDTVGDRCVYYGTPPDSDGLAPLLGTLETVVLEIEKPRLFTRSWNWRVAGADGLPHPTNPPLLTHDAIVEMTFEEAPGDADGPRTVLHVQHSGVPVEWIEDQRLLWEWSIAVFASR